MFGIVTTAPSLEPMAFDVSWKIDMDLLNLKFKEILIIQKLAYLS